MKKVKSGEILFVTVAVSVFGITVYKITDNIKKKAREDGAHIPYGPYEAVFKRSFDVLAGAVAFVIMSPVMAMTAFLVWIKLGSPVLFTQFRPGREGKIFKIYKYRTMTGQRGRDGRLLPDEKRMTSFGKALRATSLDELPELINIIKGDMSIVGPRPLLTEYMNRYDNTQARRHEVRPGLTGAAQVSGRNGLTWSEKFQKDVEYVDHITFLKDLKIILKTMVVVCKKNGISGRASVTMEKFTGGAAASCDNVKI